MKNSINPADREKIIETVSSLLYQSEKIVSAYVFGSFLSSSSFSDIDIGLVLETGIDRTLDFEISIENRLEKETRFPFDVRVLNGAPISFSQNVFRTGKLIIDRDPNFRADFESLILRQYFDLLPFRRSYLQEVTNAPV